MEKFLVTGGAGFIGSNICRRLVKDGCFVRVIDNLITGKKSNLADIADWWAEQGPSIGNSF